MGIGAKIKEAFHGDHNDQTTPDVKAPGAYPDDVPTQRHSDGKDYSTPHGDLINKKWETTGPDGTSDQTHIGTGTGTTSGTGHSGNMMSSSSPQRNKLHRDTGDHLPAQEGYSQPTHDHQARDSGVGLGQHTSTKEGTPQGAYWGDLSSEGHQGHGNTDNLPDRTHHGQGLTGTGTGRGDHNPRFEDQAVGGGVYNSVTGAGSPDHTGSHGKHHTSDGAIHDPLTSSTKGTTNIPSDSTYGQDTGRRGQGVSASRSDRIGGGLAGAEAGAAAGYGGDEYAHRGHENTGYNPSHDSGVRDTHAPGVPHSSMLDPEPGYPSSATHQSRQPPGTYSPAQHNAGNASTAAQGTGLGKDHYGPAHEGAKVMHTCQHCGQDNDISSYFEKEAVYRLGS